MPSDAALAQVKRDHISQGLIGTFDFVGRPSNGNKSMGWYHDASADVMVTSKTTATFFLGVSRGSKVQAAIYPLSGSNPLAYFA